METTKQEGRVVFAITENKHWREVGSAYVNKDQSINIYLDAMPVSGKLQIRERFARKAEEGEAS